MGTFVFMYTIIKLSHCKNKTTIYNFIQKLKGNTVPPEWRRKSKYLLIKIPKLFQHNRLIYQH